MSARRLFETAGPLIGLLFVSIIFGSLIGPRFFNGANLELIARQTAIVCTTALGMTMVIVSAGIDLSVGSVVALTTVVIAVLLRADAGPGMAALGGIVAAALCGVANGVLITGLRVIPFIVTLGMMILLRGAAKGLADERRIEAPQTWLNDLLRTLDPDSAMVVPAGIWLVVALALIVGGTLGFTRFGRHLFSIGSNERTARLCGVPVERTKICGLYRRRRSGRRCRRPAVLASVGRRSDGRERARAQRHCRRHHRRRQSDRRARVGDGNDPGGVHDGRHPDRLLATWASELAAGDRHRRHHRARGRSRSLEEPNLMVITDLQTLDLRFPTSRTQAGTDAMHSDPDYSAAYVILRTDEGLEGHGLTFTIGRGNEVCALAIEAFRSHVVGQKLSAITSDFGAFWRALAEDSQLRWLGPEKGVIHLALAAIVNAVWDLYAKSERKPLWKLLADMTPRQIVSCIDFRYITDALTPEEALDLLSKQQRGKSSARISCSGAATLPTRHRSDGSATRTSGFERCATNHWPTAGLISR